MGELGVESGGDDGAEEGEFEFGAVPPEEAVWGGDVAFEEEENDEEDSADDPPPFGDEGADADEDLGDERELLAVFCEEVSDLRDHEGHEDGEEDDAGPDEEGGVDHGRSDLGLKFRHDVEVGGEAAEDAGEGAGDFPCGDEIAIEVVETGRSFFEGFGDGGAFAKLFTKDAGDAADGDGFLAFLHDAEGLLDLETPVEEVGEFFSEEDQLGALEFDGFERGGGFGGSGGGGFFGDLLGDPDGGEGLGFELAEDVGAGGRLDIAGDGFAGGGEGAVVK